jgi:hypothetical protein
VSAHRTVAGSITRTAGFDRRPPAVEPRPREAWETGDYVICELLDSGVEAPTLEDAAGERVEIGPGDRVIGALGRRAATLKVVGDWREVGDDMTFDLLTAAGVLGRCTSAAVGIELPRARYLGHAVREGELVTMSGSVGTVEKRPLDAPVVLIIGTSMEAGKTVSAAAIVGELKRMGARVAAAKVTGVGRYRDILAMKRGGADVVADFVDAGLPTTVVDAERFEQALEILCSKLAAAEPDFVVVEAGASPLEPYNADVAVGFLEENVALTVCCASDPYAVVGLIQAFGTRPDLISGRATSTVAGMALIERLTGIPSLNMLDSGSREELASFLRRGLPGLGPGG